MGKSGIFLCNRRFWLCNYIKKRIFVEYTQKCKKRGKIVKTSYQSYQHKI